MAIRSDHPILLSITAMSRPHDFLVDSVSAFLARLTTADTHTPRRIPNSVPHLLSHLLLAIEDYIEGEADAIPLLRQACQRIVTDLGYALRAAQWPHTDAIVLVTTFIDWSMRHTVCQSTDPVTEWIAQQTPLWIKAVYRPASTIHTSSDDSPWQQMFR